MADAAGKGKKRRRTPKGSPLEEKEAKRIGEIVKSGILQKDRCLVH